MASSPWPEPEAGGPEGPPGKRLAPVGANAEDDEASDETQVGGSVGSIGKGRTHSLDLESNFSSDFWIGGEMDGGSTAGAGNSEKLEAQVRQLEQDQEELNNSLMSMTSHFAKVQLRLQQVVSAPAAEREDLLMELQQFAFRGIPNASGMGKHAGNLSDAPEDFPSAAVSVDVAESADPESPRGGSLEASQALISQRKKHSDLINQLKGQLEELEGYAYESGEGDMPSSVLLERQRVVMEQLKARLNLNMDNIGKLSEEELKKEVDEAVGNLVTPLKMKSHLITQLKTQIEDLEMFIDFLQGEASTISPGECNDCGCNKHSSSPSKKGKIPTKLSSRLATGRQGPSTGQYRTRAEQEEIRKQTLSVMERAMTLLQLTTIAQFGCGGNERSQFYKNTLKKTSKGNHFGDLRAKLEIAVDRVLEACSRIENATDTDYTETTETESTTSSLHIMMTSPEVASLVRKELAVSLRDLIHHGLVGGGSGGSGAGARSMVPFMGCMSARSSAGGGSRSMTHAWEVILKFYEMKMGHEYNSTPARKLSQSFGLDLSGSSSSNKQSLLTVIGHILATHGPYKRSPDAQFKAFVCAGLNKRKLIPWLRLVLKNQNILEQYYAPWSYVVKTGFDDALKAIERLNLYTFNLPVDVAVKQFQQMNEAF